MEHRHVNEVSGGQAARVATRAVYLPTILAIRTLISPYPFLEWRGEGYAWSWKWFQNLAVFACRNAARESGCQKDSKKEQETALQLHSIFLEMGSESNSSVRIAARLVPWERICRRIFTLLRWRRPSRSITSSQFSVNFHTISNCILLSSLPTSIQYKLQSFRNWRVLHKNVAIVRKFSFATTLHSQGDQTNYHHKEDEPDHEKCPNGYEVKKTRTRPCKERSCHWDHEKLTKNTLPAEFDCAEGEGGFEGGGTGAAVDGESGVQTCLVLQQDTEGVTASQNKRDRMTKTKTNHWILCFRGIWKNNTERFPSILHKQLLHNTRDLADQECLHMNEIYKEENARTPIT